MTEQLVVAGHGYVGLPLASASVEAGYDVVGIDLERSRVDRLSRGDSYVDDVKGARLRAALGTGRLAVSTYYALATGSPSL